MSTAHRHTPRRVTRHPAARPSALLMRLLAPIDGWLRAWWQRRVEAFQQWRRRSNPARPDTGQRLTFETLEPRVLLSAEINPAAQALLTASSASLFTASSEPTINLTPLVDADGTAVSLDISGPGTAQLAADGDGFALRVANSDATTQITLRASGGDGRIVLTGIDVTGNVGNLNLASADLSGQANFGGKLGSLILGDIANARIDVAGGGDLTLQAGKITDSQLRAPLANLALVAGNWLSTSPGAGRIELAALRSLNTTGDFSADLQVSGQGVTGYALGTVQVGGAIADGVWSIHGRGSSLQAGSTGSAWRANFSNTLVQFATRGDASGSLAVAALQLLQIGGSARGLTLLVGADLGDDAALGGSGPAADTFKAGTLARVRITGSLIDSRLLAGLDPANGVLGDGDDRQLGSTTQRLQEFIVGGLVSGSTVVAPAFPSTVRIGGANLSPSSLAPVFARTLADTVAPVLSARLQSDTGSAPDDGLTRQPALLVHLIEAGSVAAIEARFDDSGDFRAVAASLQGDGSYLIDTPALASLRGGTLPDGAYTLALRARDAASNVAAPVSVSFTLDTTAPTLSELGLAPASDTGALGDRSTTADIVTLIGRTAPGATVRLTQGDRTVAADPSGAFSFADVALALGNNAFDFTATDAAGNTATAGLSVERTAIDSTAPTLTAALANDTGASASDGITKDPTITGQAGDNVAVSQLLVALDATGTPSFTDLTGLLQPDGSFTLSAAQLASLAGGTLAEGAHDVLIRAVDAAGNATSKTVSFTLDTAAPTLSELGLAPASDTGALGDRSTTADTVTLVGQTAPGTTVRLTQGDRTTTADLSGAFSFADVALALGNNAFDFTATDAAGNTATASLSVERTAIDSTAPTLTASLANDTGVSSSDGITKDPTITGQAGDNVAVSQLLVALDATGTPSFTDLTSLLQPDGSFSLSAPQLASLAGGTLAEGSHDVLIRAIDAAGNATSKTVSFTLDTTAPTLGELGLAPASDTGVLGDRSTTADIVTLIGRTAPGTTVRLTQGDRTTTADLSGAFSFADVALVLGNNAFDFTATDPAGNVATANLSIERTAIVVDSTAPTLTASVANDTGTSASDAITKDPTITGQAGDNVAVSQLLVALDPTGTPSFTDLTSLLQPDGSFTLSAAQLASLAGGTLAEGAHVVLIRAIDAAGNATSQTVSFTLDTIAPTLGELGLDPASDTGALGDRSTTADTVTLTGQAAPGATVRLTQGDRTDVADPSGAFSFANVALALGNNAFDFIVTDAAGNTATASLSVERTAVDSTAPTLTASLANDTGFSSSDAITKDPTITGQASDNVAVSQLLVALDPTASPSFTDLTSLLQPDGSFSLSAAQLARLAGGTLAEGSHDVLIRAMDAAGNATSKTVSFTLDTSAPTLNELGLAPASDTGVLGDRSTTADTVTLTGQAAPGTTVRLTQGDRTVTADPSGAFSFADVALALGNNAFDFTATDAAGNIGTGSLSVERTVIDST
ncbi:MAG: LEPR-XLL domain-containing protein, partial [Candidatus Accumulibacter phosphatis]|uniref:Ig-like domain-containing protein n=1 Tax=Candidatus Accumulibacter phosphatis TaxID=327160 RepID=UPI001A4FF877|nr:LEPR-XLL domain-containing protein [Candidatus Accumulibacter phosphatis]